MVPVQEYNIKERITKANEQLLQSPVLNRNYEPRVTFHEIIENFEPDSDDGYVDSFEVDVSSNSELEASEKYTYTNTNNEEMNDLQSIRKKIAEYSCSVEEDITEIADYSEKQVLNISDTIQTLSVKDDTCCDTHTFECESDICDNFESSSESELNIKIIEHKQKINERLSLTFCNGNFRRRIEQPTPVLKLKYRYCCKHDINKQQKLPQYDGLNSEYGLSKSQLLMKVEKQKLFRIQMLKNKKQKIDDKVKRNQINENAFARWLKNKESKRKPNKNMYK